MIRTKGVVMVEALVSIIMPVHNCEEYIAESINSICNQTYKNIEIIVVDTGSEDRTLEIINKIDDDRIKRIQLKGNQGLTTAFYKGFQHAKGEFIVRQDPDDISVATRIQLQVDYLNQHQELGMVSCLIKCFSNNATYRNECIFIEKLQNHYITKRSIEESIVKKFIPLIFPTLMIRRTLFDNITIPKKPKGFDDQIQMLLDLIKVGPVEKINKVLYYYRRHEKAYHLENAKEYEDYVMKLLEKSDINDYIMYSDLYKNIKINKVESKQASNSPIRILMLIDGLNIGGTETHVLGLCKKLMEMGIHVVIATKGGPMTKVFEGHGIKVVKIPIRSDYISNKYVFSTLKAVEKVIKEEKINLLHCHLFASMAIGNEIYKRHKTPYIVTIHGLFYPNDVLYATCMNAESIICVSEPVKKYIWGKLKGRVRDKVVVIPNGIGLQEQPDEEQKNSIRAELNIPKEDTVITYCSRLAWEKTAAAESFIFSCFKLALQYETLHAIVIGDGPGSGLITREAELLNKSIGRDIIHVVGAKFNVLEYYQESDIVVGTARVALEALSLSKPVIAVGNEGYVGIVQEKNKELQWKMYFGDHDALEETDILTLTEDIKYLVDYKKEREEIGAWGREWCKEIFDETKNTKMIVDLYQKHLNNDSNNKVLL